MVPWRHFQLLLIEPMQAISRIENRIDKQFSGSFGKTLYIIITGKPGGRLWDCPRLSLFFHLIFDHSTVPFKPF